VAEILGQGLGIHGLQVMAEILRQRLRIPGLQLVATREMLPDELHQRRSVGQWLQHDDSLLQGLVI
jgi:hypothetical protein